MPREHGWRLAKLLPKVSHVEISETCTLIPEDQPRQLVADFQAVSRNSPNSAR